MEDFWLDETKSNNRLFRFFIRHDLKWIFLHERPLGADCVEKLENHGAPKISQM
jgi:hypothetical protein